MSEHVTNWKINGKDFSLRELKIREADRIQKLFSAQENNLTASSEAAEEFITTVLVDEAGHQATAEDFKEMTGSQIIEVIKSFFLAQMKLVSDSKSFFNDLMNSIKSQ